MKLPFLIDSLCFLQVRMVLILRIVIKNEYLVSHNFSRNFLVGQYLYVTKEKILAVGETLQVRTKPLWLKISRFVVLTHRTFMR
jgi:hypothetical protein